MFDRRGRLFPVELSIGGLTALHVHPEVIEFVINLWS